MVNEVLLTHPRAARKQGRPAALRTVYSDGSEDLGLDLNQAEGPWSAGHLHGLRFIVFQLKEL